MNTNLRFFSLLRSNQNNLKLLKILTKSIKNSYGEWRFNFGI